MASKTAELRELTHEQLLERAESAKEELFNLRFQLATGQLDDSSSIKKIRHEIARIATVMRERDIEEARAAATYADAEASDGVPDEQGPGNEQGPGTEPEMEREA
jgi:large subunit ribosomal protein L29